MGRSPLGRNRRRRAPCQRLNLLSLESGARTTRASRAFERSIGSVLYQHGADGRARYKRYVVHDGFAWGRKGATELTPEALCKGARDRYLLMKIAEGRLTFFDGPAHEADLQAALVVVDDHYFTLNDGNQNLNGTEIVHVPHHRRSAHASHPR